MTIVEEIKQMRSQGLTNEQIQDNLKSRGISDKDIKNGLSQSQIKAAVEQDAFPTPLETQGQNMEKSILPASSETTQTIMQQTQNIKPIGQNQIQQPQETIPPIQPPTTQEYVGQIQEYAPQEGYDEYQPYQSYSTGASPEMITEISEQVIAEKLSGVRKKLEKALDAKNTMSTKVDYLEERLKRIEKIIDTLQSSVLRKVGDYIMDVKDIKQELIETQKSLGKIFPKVKDKHPKKHQAKHKK